MAWWWWWWSLPSWSMELVACTCDASSITAAYLRPQIVTDVSCAGDGVLSPCGELSRLVLKCRHPETVIHLHSRLGPQWSFLCNCLPSCLVDIILHYSTESFYSFISCPVGRYHDLTARWTCCPYNVAQTPVSERVWCLVSLLSMIHMTALRNIISMRLGFDVPFNNHDLAETSKVELIRHFMWRW